MWHRKEKDRIKMIPMMVKRGHFSLTWKVLMTYLSWREELTINMESWKTEITMKSWTVTCRSWISHWWWGGEELDRGPECAAHNELDQWWSRRHREEEDRARKELSVEE
jgi:hypothetical protein